MAPLRTLPAPGTRGPRSLAAAWRGDRLLPVLAVLYVADTTWTVAAQPDQPRWLTLAWPLLPLAGCVALAFRKRWPVPVAAGVLLAAGVYYPGGESDGALMMVLFALALHNLAVEGQLTAAGTLAVLALLGTVYGEAVNRPSGETNVTNMSLILLAGWFLGVIAFGHATRSRHAYLHEAEQRARAAERERDVRARQAATEERLRIARELHDVLGHNVSLIHVQAAAALHRSARRPGETAELVTALEFARDTSKDALRELRATLGALRQVDEAAPTGPTGGLDRVEELVERARAAGLDVTTETAGEPRTLPPQISLAAYRIVQESLTNTTRHARATRVHVRLEYAPEELRVRVEDNGVGAPEGAGPAPGGAGSGIGGMSERARALGGELTAGGTGDGFRVRARLPLDS